MKDKHWGAWRVVGALLLLSILAGCTGGGAAPGPAATATPEAAAAQAAGAQATNGGAWQPPMDLSGPVKDMLNSLPDAWGLLPPQAFAGKKTFLVDVRDPDEFKQGFIEGAVNIPLRDLTGSLTALPAQDQPVTLVCDSGSRAAIGMVTLQMLGWKQAKSMYGGIKGWQEAKLPLVTGAGGKRPNNPAPKVDAQLLSVLDGYLRQGLAADFGLTDAPGLTRAMALPRFEDLTDPEQWAQGPPFIIDVSEPAEFSKGTIGEAINMPLRSIPASLDMIPWKNPSITVCGQWEEIKTMDRTWKYIVTICPNGHRAAVAMMAFQLLGFRDVHALEGGLKAWKAAGNQ